MPSRPQAEFRELIALHEYFRYQGYDHALCLTLAATWIGCCLATARNHGLPASEMMREVLSTIQEAYNAEGQNPVFH